MFFGCRMLLSVAALMSSAIWASAQNKTSSKFTLLRRGQAPTVGVKLLSANISTRSVSECAQLCWNHDNSIGCGGFAYLPASCTSRVAAGRCQLMQFVNISLLVFGPAASSCQQFYVSASPVKLINLAKNSAVAYQSSTYFPLNASLAIDGNIATYSCTGAAGVHPWLTVDLIWPVQVQMVAVFIIYDLDYPYRMDNFMVGLTNSQPIIGPNLTAGVNYTVCAQYNGRPPAGVTVNMVCPQNAYQYRYVIVQGMLSFNDALCVVEVSVY